MTRHLKAAAAFLSVLGGLGLSSALLEHHAAAQAKGAVQAPRFEVDPLWPKPLPNHWILGQTIGVSVDAQDHVWIIHRAGSLEPGEVHADDDSADRAVLRAGAADSRVRRRRQSDRPLGRSGPGLRLARLEPRHHGRLQGQRLDRRQRPRRAAGGRAAGSRPARAEPPAGREPDRRHAVVQRQHGPEVHAATASS